MHIYGIEKDGDALRVEQRLEQRIDQIEQRLEQKVDWLNRKVDDLTRWIIVMLTVAVFVALFLINLSARPQ